ncbi:MAG: hypothetical protein HYS86_05200, partial [Candidatus Chisholmbacteria bacterium]|nr:hypothetical protein [Candidatus Chisholmbacteria bacterium]
LSKPAKDDRNLYTVSSGEIIWKNFLAGLSRALGGMIIYLILLGVIAYAASQYLLPQLEPLLSSLQMLTNPQTLQPGTQNPQQLEQLLRQLQR